MRPSDVDEVVRDDRDATRGTMELETEADILALLEAYVPAASLAAALELGLFWKLADGPKAPERLAEELGVPLERAAPWFAHLATLGLLERDPQAVWLSATARTAIVDARSRETWGFHALEAREDYAAGLDLAHRLREPVAPLDPSGPLPPHLTGYVTKMREDPDRARRFTRFLYELHGYLGDDVANALDLAGVRRLLDLGGGSGVVSLALLRRNPELSVVVADLPAVCAAGREIADATSVGDRLTHHPVEDFVRDELPGGFDAVLQCDVAIFTPALFAQIAGALVDGGRFIAVERWFDAGEPMDARQVDYLFRWSLRDAAFAFPTLEQIRRDLGGAGLDLVWVGALPRSGWKVLEARKIGDPAG